MPYQMDEVRDFTGGVNIASSPDSLLQNQCLEFTNLIPNLTGGADRRSGYTENSDIEVDYSVKRFIEFEYIVGTVPVIKRLALANSNLYDTLDNAEIVTGLEAHADYEVYKNKAYILSGGRFMVHDGASIADVTNGAGDSNLTEIAKCKYIEQYGERLFASGNPDNPNELYFSEIADPTYWKTTSVIQAISDDGDVITGLKEFHSGLLVFKAGYIYVWYGVDPTTDVVFKRVNADTGTKAYRTIQRVGNKLFYLGDDGVYRLNAIEVDMIATDKVSKTIEPIFENIKYYADNKHYLNTACAIFDRGRYILNIPTTYVGVNDTTAVHFDNPLQNEQLYFSWGFWTNYRFNAFLQSHDGEIYMGSSLEDGKIYKHTEGVYNDNGSGIPVTLRTRPLSQGSLVNIKKYRKAYIIARQSKTLADVSLTVGFRAGYIEERYLITVTESMIWGQPWGQKWGYKEVVVREYSIRERNERVELLVEENTADTPLVIYGFALEFKVKKPKKYPDPVVETTSPIPDITPVPQPEEGNPQLVLYDEVLVEYGSVQVTYDAG